MDQVVRLTKYNRELFGFLVSDDMGVKCGANMVLNPQAQAAQAAQAAGLIGLSQNLTLQSCCSNLLNTFLRQIQMILQGNTCWVVRKSSLSCEEIVGEEAGRGVGSNLDRGRRKNAATLLITLSASHIHCKIVGAHTCDSLLPMLCYHSL